MSTETTLNLEIPWAIDIRAIERMAKAGRICVIRNINIDDQAVIAVSGDVSRYQSPWAREVQNGNASE